MDATLTHVRLLVDDYSACFRFYRDVLGFEPTFGDEESGYADFDAGNATLALFERGEMAEAVGTTDHPVTADARDRVAVVLHADDLDETCRALQGSGVEFVTEPTDRPDWDIRVAHLRDPDGTLLELNEPIPMA